MIENRNGGVGVVDCYYNAINKKEPEIKLKKKTNQQTKG